MALLEMLNVRQGTKIKKRLKTLRNELKECIEPQYGLLTKLVSASTEVLNTEELDDIQLKGPSSKQCAELLNIMQRKQPIECEKFIEALIAKEQKHVANYIRQKARRFDSDHVEFLCWPLEQLHRKRITRNLDNVMELIECEHSNLLAHLYSGHCINRRQMISITQLPLTDPEKTEKLLKMLLRRSIGDYNVFVEFLTKSEDMSYLACLFEEDFAVEAVDCSIACPSAERVRELESKIVSKFRTANKELRKWIKKLIHRDCHPDAELVKLKDKHSLRCFFFCGTPDALQSLYLSIGNGSLITTMQAIFQQLLGCEESVFVVKITGRLNVNEQKKRIAEFCTDIGSVSETEFFKDSSVTEESASEVQRTVGSPRILGEQQNSIAEGNTDRVLHKNVYSSGSTEFSKGHSTTEESESESEKPWWFIYDVLEPILLQVAIKSFKRNQLRLLLPHPGVTSMLNISGVCKDWFDVITGRRILRRKMKTTFRKSTVPPMELFKAAVLLRHRLVDQSGTSRDADVTVLNTMTSVCHRWMFALGGSGDLKRRLKRLFHHNPQLLFTLNDPPTDSDGHPLQVRGVVMLENFVYVVYFKYNKVEVFDGEDCYKKVRDIEVEQFKAPRDMVGSSVTSQLFISYWSYVIVRVDVKTGVSDVFVKLDSGGYAWLSLVQNRLLVTSRDSLLMYDILSGKRIKNIPLPEDWKKHVVLHAIESNRDSFFVIHRPSDSENCTLNEIDSEGRVIRVFNNDEQLRCVYLALDSVGRLLVTDWFNDRVVLFNEHLQFERILFDNKRLDNERPSRLNYGKHNNRLAVGLNNGQVKIIECNVS